MDSRFKEWVYIEGLMQSAYHEAALKMNLSDSEFWILYVFNFHQEGCNQSVLYKEACLTKSTVNSAIRKMEQKDLLYLTPGEGRNTMVFLTEKGRKLMEDTVYKVIQIENTIYDTWTHRQRLRYSGFSVAHRPKESSCPLVEKTVARIFSSTWSFIQAASTGSLMVRISPASRNTNNMNQKLRPTAKRTRNRIYPALVDMTTLVRLTVPFFSMRAMSN